MNSIKAHFVALPPGTISPELVQVVKERWPDLGPPSAYHLFEILDRGQRTSGISNMCDMVLETLLARACAQENVDEDDLEAHANKHWRNV